MLTREEANILLNKITAVWAVQSSRNDYLIDCVNEFTEKSKREIRMGDIYLNNCGEICRISDPKDCKSKEDEVHVQNSGKYLRSGEPNERYACHLDLSKRYILVEVTDAD